jgi:hypothetical protein
METKVCRRCLIEKSLELFRQRSGRPIGQRLSYCGPCQGLIGKAGRLKYAKTEKGKAASARSYRKRHPVIERPMPEPKPRNPPRVFLSPEERVRRSKESRDRYAKTEKGRVAIAKYRAKYRKSLAGVAVRRRSRRTDTQRLKARLYRALNHDKALARDNLKRAIHRGELSRGPCVKIESGVCRGPIHGHHHLGYAPEHWLDVTWLCGFHHWELHHPDQSCLVPEVPRGPIPCSGSMESSDPDRGGQKAS